MCLFSQEHTKLNDSTQYAVLESKQKKAQVAQVAALLARNEAEEAHIRQELCGLAGLARTAATVTPAVDAIAVAGGFSTPALDTDAREMAELACNRVAFCQPRLNELDSLQSFEDAAYGDQCHGLHRQELKTALETHPELFQCGYIGSQLVSLVWGSWGEDAGPDKQSQAVVVRSIAVKERQIVLCLSSSRPLFCLPGEPLLCVISPALYTASQPATPLTLAV